MKFSEEKIESYSVSTFCVPTLAPEADGTIEWNSTTMVLVELTSGKHKSIGYTYGHKAIEQVVESLLNEFVMGHNAMNIPAIWSSLVRATRNMGRSGLCAMAVSAIDNSLWDLKAKILNRPLVTLLGCARPEIEIYGSGGFTSFTLEDLEKQINGWLEKGIKKIKIKVGSHPEEDLSRVKFVRQLIGNKIELFVDANEAYNPRQALDMAKKFSDFDVKWFEQPISDEDLERMCFIRSRMPPSMILATGEYAHDPHRFYQILSAGACDVMQADTTRCQGITGFLKAAGLCEAAGVPLSSHCAPALHVPLGCSLQGFQHLEFFSDHERVEEMFFERPFTIKDGKLLANTQSAGFGLEFKRNVAQGYVV